MGRYRKNPSSKAKPVPISLKPSDLKKLEELEKVTGKKRSSLIQYLIDKEYKKRFGGSTESPDDLDFNMVPRDWITKTI